MTEEGSSVHRQKLNALDPVAVLNVGTFNNVPNEVRETTVQNLRYEQILIR